ncbi:MAG: hypothetical protein JEZ09_01340 [Salinivirgaceae bacterium]|nr:hypothetical protein [Salinivirgaceae bacterium]
MRCIVFIFLQLIIGINSYSQSNNNWIDEFEDADKQEIITIEEELSQTDIAIFNYFATTFFDSIAQDIYTIPISREIFETLNNRLLLKQKLSDIYTAYVNGTKYSIDSIQEFKLSLDLNVMFIQDEYKKLTLTTNELENTEDTISMILILQKNDNSWDLIHLNAKQFFTFYSLASKTYLIKKGYSSNLSTENTSIKNDIPHVESDITYANVIINNEIVESIQLAISNYEEDTTNSFYNIYSYDLDNLIDRWNAYLYEEEAFDIVLDDSTAFNTVDDMVAIDTKVQYKEPEKQINAQISTSKNNEQNNAKTEQNSTDETSNNTESSHETRNQDYTPINSNSRANLVFRVQIAADNVPLSENKLAKIYNGPRKIQMFQEEGWYKYYIAECSTLREAVGIKKESMVSDAFVMAYKDGKKVKYYLKYVHAEKGSIPPLDFIDLKSLSSNKTIIVIQIAADKVPLDNNTLKEIYSGKVPINYLYEDGWHKYSFGNFKRFWPANFARRKCGVPGAFIVAYRNGEKIDLWADSKKD